MLVALRAGEPRESCDFPAPPEPYVQFSRVRLEHLPAYRVSAALAFVLDDASGEREWMSTSHGGYRKMRVECRLEQHRLFPKSFQLFGCIPAALPCERLYTPNSENVGPQFLSLRQLHSLNKRPALARDEIPFGFRRFCGSSSEPRTPRAHPVLVSEGRLSPFARTSP